MSQSEGTSIAELFETDPLHLTREKEIPLIVEYYRKARLQFKLGDKTAGSTKTMASGGKTKKDSIDVELDL